MHENVNYLNNKAEVGQCWSGHNNTRHDNNASGTVNQAFECRDFRTSSIPSDAPPPIPHHLESPKPSPRVRPKSTLNVNQGVNARPKSHEVVYANHQFQKLANKVAPIELTSHKDTPLPEVPSRPVPAKRPKKT